jgi:hypothetical protein
MAMMSIPEQKEIWQNDPESLINKALKLNEKELDFFRLTFDEYFNLMEKGDNATFQRVLSELNANGNESHRIANRVAHYSSVFTPKGIDNYLFKEDHQEIIASVIEQFKNSLVIPHTKYYEDTQTFGLETNYGAGTYKFTIWSPRINQYGIDYVIVGSCDRSLKFKIRIMGDQTVENNMIKTEIAVGYDRIHHKDFDTWESINSAEKKVISLIDPSNVKTKEVFKYIKCEGLEHLNESAKKYCAKITNLSSKRCKWCTELEQGDFDDYDNEPDYSELDQGAEDEAMYYMKLDNDQAIARGEMPPWNYSDTN